MGLDEGAREAALGRLLVVLEDIAGKAKEDTRGHVGILFFGDTLAAVRCQARAEAWGDHIKRLAGSQRDLSHGGCRKAGGRGWETEWRAERSRRVRDDCEGGFPEFWRCWRFEEAQPRRV